MTITCERRPTTTTARAIDPTIESRRAARRMAQAGERPFCLADWSRALFVHYAVDPAALQPHVPFPLDLCDGKAYVSLVAFTQENVRPQFAGGLGRLGRRIAARCAAFAAHHAFLNLRTYVRHHGERGIYFLTEWIPNLLDRLIGPATYGLPYRLGRVRYDYDGDGRPLRGDVVAGGEAFRFDARVDDAAGHAPVAAHLDRFLLERYTAYTGRSRTLRRFRIWHAPWPQARATVATRCTTLLDRAAPWLGGARPVAAHFSPGVRDVRIGPPRKIAPVVDTSGTIAPLIGLAAAALPALAWNGPRWAFMWAVAFALFFTCKWATWRRAAGRMTPRPAAARSLAYLFGWVGMDAAAFLDEGRRPARPARREWLAAALKTLAGAALVWGAARSVPVAYPLLAGWAGMVGLALLLHFGTFHLLALLWRRAGVNATPIMREPARSKSLAEFWSVRWNRGFHELAFEGVFRPLLAARFRPTAALLATFLASGIVHELVISLPAGGGWGGPTLYFAIQGLGVLAERSRIGGRAGRRFALRGKLFTLACTVLPLPLLFHALFVRAVVLPFLRALGAV